MPRRKTDAEFRKEVKALVGDEYTVLNKYISSYEKIKFEHQKCNSVFEMLPGSFLQGHRCPNCAIKVAHAKQKKSNSKFKKQVKLLVGDEYAVLGEYINCKTRICFKHQKCGNLFKMIPNNFLRGARCPYCFMQNIGKWNLLSGTEFQQRIKELGNNEYKSLSQFKGCNLKVLMLHKICGHKYFVTPAHFFSGRRCPFCQNEVRSVKQRTPFSKISQRVNQIGNGEYRISRENYKNTSSKAVFYHKRCKRFFQMSFTSFACGQRCPYCKSSKGEKIVQEYLEGKSAIFQTQYKIPECKDKRPLPFDFAVFNKNKSLNCLIEYQGEQHFYDPFSYHDQWFSKESVLDTQKHDAIKLRYCKDNGIKLIRINHPQTDYDSNSIEFIERLVNRTLNRELHVV